MAKIRTHLEVSGRVQGVYFRYAAKEVANRLGLTGWIRNLPNGKVEAVVEGEEADVEEMIEWCYQGPPGAKVSRVNVQRNIARGDFSWFEITYY
jgi:acylphosphatase